MPLSKKPTNIHCVAYTQNENSNIDVWKYNLLFFFFFITQNVRMGREEQVGDDWNAHTHRGNGAVFLWNFSAFLFCSLRSKSSLVYVIFGMPSQSLWSHLWPMCCMWICLLSSMPPTQLPWHFHWRIPCILFTLGNSYYILIANWSYKAYSLFHFETGTTTTVFNLPDNLHS